MSPLDPPRHLLGPQLGAKLGAQKDWSGDRAPRLKMRWRIWGEAVAWRKPGEHLGTPLYTSHHGITAKNYPDGYIRTLLFSLIAPVNVLDISVDCAEDLDVLLAVAHIQGLGHCARLGQSWRLGHRGDWDARPPPH